MKLFIQLHTDDEVEKGLKGGNASLKTPSVSSIKTPGASSGGGGKKYLYIKADKPPAGNEGKTPGGYWKVPKGLAGALNPDSPTKQKDLDAIKPKTDPLSEGLKDAELGRKKGGSFDPFSKDREHYQDADAKAHYKMSQMFQDVDPKHSKFHEDLAREKTGDLDPAGHAALADDLRNEGMHEHADHHEKQGAASATEEAKPKDGEKKIKLKETQLKFEKKPVSDIDKESRAQGSLSDQARQKKEQTKQQFEEAQGAHKEALSQLDQAKQAMEGHTEESEKRQASLEKDHELLTNRADRLQNQLKEAQSRLGQAHSDSKAYQNTKKRIDQLKNDHKKARKDLQDAKKRIAEHKKEASKKAQEHKQAHNEAGKQAKDAEKQVSSAQKEHEQAPEIRPPQNTQEEIKTQGHRQAAKDLSQNISAALEDPELDPEKKDHLLKIQSEVDKMAEDNGMIHPPEEEKYLKELQKQAGEHGKKPKEQAAPEGGGEAPKEIPDAPKDAEMLNRFKHAFAGGQAVGSAMGQAAASPYGEAGSVVGTAVRYGSQGAASVGYSLLHDKEPKGMKEDKAPEAKEPASAEPAESTSEESKESDTSLSAKKNVAKSMKLFLRLP